MSSASARVRFPDGEVRHCIYHGTSDTLVPQLFDTSREAWDTARTGWPETGEVSGEVFDVEIYSDYGGGFYWGGQATREFVLSDFTAPFDDDFNPRRIETTDGEPEWVVW